MLKVNSPITFERQQSNTPERDDHQAIRTFADLFCGVGGFHLAAASLGLECVFASDIDKDACQIYERNFGVKPAGDIVDIRADQIPDHDILFAGLPCQPFSIIGKRNGFADARGNLFIEAARIIAAKRPYAVVIENVRQFATLDSGKPLACVTSTLSALGYNVEWRILNALDFGLPQKRERVFIIGVRGVSGISWPAGNYPMKSLVDVLEEDPDESYFASPRIQRSRQNAHQATASPMIWHENKGGNVNSHPYSCALRAGASYNYLLVDGKRRLTPREMFRLQGFPDEYELPKTITASRKLSGNAVPVPVVSDVIGSVLEAFKSRTSPR